MTALLRSELLRMRSRRMVWVLVIAGLIGIVVGSTIVAVKSHPPTPAQLAEAQSTYQSALSSCLKGEFGVTGSDLGGLTLKQWCHQNVTLESYSGSNEYTLVSLPDALLGTSFLMIVMGIVIGASAIGAEWSAGTVTTLLAWESRRTRVLLVRLLTVAITVALLTLFLQTLLSLALWAVAATRGTTAGTGGPGSAWFHQVAATVGRMTVVVALVSAIGLAIATIGRGTAAALGALFAYLALFESLLRGFRPTIAPWLLGQSVATYLTGHATQIYTNSDRPTVVGVVHSLAVTCAYAGGLLLLALFAFRSRDVN